VITTRNDGPAIVSTSYWTTEQAKAGLLYLSINAGTLRMLAPVQSAKVLAELPPIGTHCDLVADVVDGRATYLLSWYDDPASPYQVEIDRRQCSSTIPVTAEAGRVVPLVWYLPSGIEGVREARRETIQIGTLVAS